MGGRDRGGRMSDMGPDKTDTDWRARPSADSDDGPQRRDDAFGERESTAIIIFNLSPALIPLLFTGQCEQQLKRAFLLPTFIQDHGTVTSRIVTEMAHGETTTAMTEEETATGIDMMTGTAETTTEEVCYSACAPALLCTLSFSTL